MAKGHSEDKKGSSEILLPIMNSNHFTLCMNKKNYNCMVG